MLWTGTQPTGMSWTRHQPSGMLWTSQQPTIVTCLNLQPSDQSRAEVHVKSPAHMYDRTPASRHVQDQTPTFGNALDPGPASGMHWTRHQPSGMLWTSQQPPIVTVSTCNPVISHELRCVSSHQPSCMTGHQPPGMSRTRHQPSGMLWTRQQPTNVTCLHLKFGDKSRAEVCVQSPTIGVTGHHPTGWLGPVFNQQAYSEPINNFKVWSGTRTSQQPFLYDVSSVTRHALDCTSHQACSGPYIQEIFFQKTFSICSARHTEFQVS